MGFVAEALIFMIPIVGSIALFAFLAVAAWASERRRERQAYYQYEFRKRLVEAGKLDAEDVRSMVEFEHRADMDRRRQGMLAGGLIAAAVGLGLIFGLRFIDEPVWMVGYIPLAIGVAMFVYGLAFARDTPVPQRWTPPGEES